MDRIISYINDDSSNYGINNNNLEEKQTTYHGNRYESRIDYENYKSISSSDLRFLVESLKRGIIKLEKINANIELRLLEAQTEKKADKETDDNHYLNLEEIKEVVENIEEFILSPTFGLEEIKSEVINIEEIVELIAEGINVLEAKFDNSFGKKGSFNFTTGIAAADSSVQSIVVIVQNNTLDSKIVSINLYRYNMNDNISEAQQLENCTRIKCTPANRAPDTSITIPAGRLTLRIYDLKSKNCNIETGNYQAFFEVQFTGIDSGMSAWVGARSSDADTPLEKSTFIPANVYRFEHLVPFQLKG